MAKQMELRTFSLDDWPWVQDWFQDALLNRELGPMDTDWLDAVLGERNGIQLVATSEGRPVALIGCAWGLDQDQSHYITDIAVAPSMRGQGIGTQALELVTAWPGHPPIGKWTAFVNLRNLAAQSLLRRNNWQAVGVADGMITFEKSSIK